MDLLNNIIIVLLQILAIEIILFVTCSIIYVICYTYLAKAKTNKKIKK
ncbi:MAG: hypothetical protein RR478_05560 [Bacilli bacterium]